jgi:hypothetical protein
MIYPLIKFGSVYATEDNMSSGTRYIAIVEGLEGYQLTDNVQTERALDGTIYNQYVPVKDVPVSVTFPLIDVTKYDAIRDVIQAAITGLTTYSLDITSDAGTFTFTAKPAENPITFQTTNLSGKLANVKFSQLVTD